MPESIFEHTTSIAGLTCKPLSILSETISPQEMSMARGGNDGSGGPTEQVSQAEIDSWLSEAQKAAEEQKPKVPDLLEGEHYPNLSYGIGGEGINPIGDAFEWCVNQVSEDLEEVWEELKEAGEELEEAWEELEEAWDWLTGDEEEEDYSEDETEEDTEVYDL